MQLRLQHLDNREFASTLTGSFNWWTWICDAVAFEFGCDPDSVNSIDLDDGDELIAIDNEPVARLVREYGLVA